MNWKAGVWILFMVINSIFDLKKKRISLRICVLAGLIGGAFGVWDVWQENVDFISAIKDVLIAMLPGIAVFVICFVSRQAIGAGDGIIVFITGLYFGAMETAEILLLALICSSLTGIYLMIFKKVNKKTEIPFVPFLLAGYLLKMI